MPKRNVYHVVATDKGWSLQPEGNERDWLFYSTKDEAIDEGRKVAESQQPSQLIIHLENGRIEEERTYGDDPRDVRG